MPTMTRSMVARLRWVTATSDAKSIRASFSFQPARPPLADRAAGLLCRSDDGDLFQKMARAKSITVPWKAQWAAVVAGFSGIIVSRRQSGWLCRRRAQFAAGWESE